MDLHLTDTLSPINFMMGRSSDMASSWAGSSTHDIAMTFGNEDYPG